MQPIPLFEAKQIFDGRSKEIRRYLDMLIAIRDRKADRLMYELNGELLEVPDFRITRELQKTLQATAYLMLYNLVEATMTISIDAIHRHIEQSGASFDDLNREVRLVMLRGVRKALDNNANREFLFDTTKPVASIMTSLGYDPKDLFSGNLDGKLIRETAEIYGFDVDLSTEDRRRNAAGLQQIKNRRNDLAHGSVSFEQCGHDSSVDEINSLFEGTRSFLESVIQGIEGYLLNNRFRHSPILIPTTPQPGAPGKKREPKSFLKKLFGIFN